MATIVTRASIHFDYETVAEYVLTIDALDPHAATGRATVSILLNDLEEIELPVNQAPYLASTVFFVDENVGDEFTPAQTVIGSALSADDPDNSIDEITYQIVGDSEQFELVVAAGVATIVTRAAIHFDYETVAEYVLTIDALDPHAAAGRATVSIVLNDLEEQEYVESFSEPDDPARFPLLIGYVDRAVNAAVLAMVREAPTPSGSWSSPPDSQPADLENGFASTADSSLERTDPFEALLRHDFSYTLAGGGAHRPIVRAWSGGSRSIVNADYFADNLGYEGAVNAGVVGFELETASRSRRAGMAVSFADADFDFVIDGEDIAVERDMFMLYPYLYWDVNSRVRVWGLLGVGAGDYRSESGDQGGDAHQAKMFAFDGGLDYQWQYDGFDLALGLESWNTSSWLTEGQDQFTEHEAETFSTQAGLEIAHPFVWKQQDLTLRPLARLQARLDRGDSGKKTVADLRGGAKLHWGAGLQIDVDGMVQVTTRESRQTRANMAIAYDFASDGRGLLLEMDSSVEGSSAHGSEFATSSRIGSRIGWGRPIRFFGASGIMTAQIRMEDYRIFEWGWDFQANRFGFGMAVDGASSTRLRYYYRP